VPPVATLSSDLIAEAKLIATWPDGPWKAGRTGRARRFAVAVAKLWGAL
jgi:hypothetical protein